MTPKAKKDLLDSFCTGMIKVCDQPNLRIRRFPRTEYPEIKTLKLLRRYAHIGRNDLTDFDGARYYLRRGDLYVLRFDETIYFYYPLTGQVSHNKRGNVSEDTKEMIVEAIRSN